MEASKEPVDSNVKTYVSNKINIIQNIRKLVGIITNCVFRVVLLSFSELF